MPNLGLSSIQARNIAAYLSGFDGQFENSTGEITGIPEDDSSPGIGSRFFNGVKDIFPRATEANATRYGLALVVVGAISGIAVAILSLLIIRNVQRRRGLRDATGTW